MLLEDLFKDADPQIRLVEGLDHPFALPEGMKMLVFFTISHLDVFDLQVRSPSLGGMLANFVDKTVHLQG